MSLTAEQIIESKILNGLQEGDQRAWSTFYTRYSPVVLAAARKVLASSPHPGDEAEDIAQLVFMKLLKHNCRLLANYDPTRGSLSTWLTVVARSTALDAVRAQARARAQRADYDPEAVPAEDSWNADATRPEPDFACLTDRQRTVIRLLVSEDLDLPEVARRLGIGVQTVRSLKHQSIQRLRHQAGLDAAPRQAAPRQTAPPKAA